MTTNEVIAPRDLYRQQAEFTKEREELNSLFEILKIMKEAVTPQEEQNDR
jgi:hypothetical protein